MKTSQFVWTSQDIKLEAFRLNYWKSFCDICLSSQKCGGTNKEVKTNNACKTCQTMPSPASRWHRRCLSIPEEVMTLKCQSKCGLYKQEQSGRTIVTPRATTSGLTLKNAEVFTLKYSSHIIQLDPLLKNFMRSQNYFFWLRSNCFLMY